MTRFLRRPLGRWPAIVGLATLTLLVGACDELDNLLGDPDEVQLTGQNAFVHIARDPSRAPQPNIQAISDVIALQSDMRMNGGSTTDSAARFDPGEEVIDVMRQTSRSRGNIQTKGFDRVDFRQFDTRKDNNRPRRKDESLFPSPDLSTLRSDEYWIPDVNKIPVRNQGARGTCAAFAGVGHLEYAAVRSYPNLSTIDLSEQRFYYLSKPECHDTGCRTPEEEGSWYGSGLEASAASSVLDIPLETDCAYNASPGDNDPQTPQAASCSDGAFKVATNGLEYVATPQQIIDRLNAGFAVPFASPLSFNWEENNGLITLAESGFAGNTFHSSGHAYLIVGYRRLPDMPDEGGMCFIVKNSWGSGWGVDGYACQTLAWIQNWHFDYAPEHPIATSIELRDDLSMGQMPMADDTTNGGFFNDETYTDDTVNSDVVDNDTIPDPPPSPPLMWRRAFLEGPDNSFYQVEIAEEGTSLFVRGQLGGGRTTNILELRREADALFTEGDQVGTITEGGTTDLTLCSGPFDLLCSLRLEPSSNRLYIQFINLSLRKVRDSELGSGDWVTLSWLPMPSGYELQFFSRGTDTTSIITQALSRRFYVRLVKNGQITDTLRLSVSGGGEIRLMGAGVGSVNPANLAFCSGSYNNACSLFASQRGLTVLPNW